VAENCFSIVFIFATLCLCRLRARPLFKFLRCVRHGCACLQSRGANLRGISSPKQIGQGRSGTASHSSTGTAPDQHSVSKGLFSVGTDVFIIGHWVNVATWLADPRPDVCVRQGAGGASSGVPLEAKVLEDSIQRFAAVNHGKCHRMPPPPMLFSQPSARSGQKPGTSGRVRRRVKWLALPASRKDESRLGHRRGSMISLKPVPAGVDRRRARRDGVQHISLDTVQPNRQTNLMT
jgi:hypothetical protein